MKKVNFEIGSYYHVYNRGVDKRNVFLDDYDYLRFIRSMREFNQTTPIGSIYHKDFRDKKFRCSTPKALGVEHLNLVRILAYCLNPNHYHFILEQLAENGISEFMKRVGGGYTNYFNAKHDRSGALFQGAYKAIEINTTPYLLYLSAYINGNYEIHKYGIAEDWPWSSYPDYLGKRAGTMCVRDVISSEFVSVKSYESFVSEVIFDSIKVKEEIKNLLLE